MKSTMKALLGLALVASSCGSGSEPIRTTSFSQVDVSSSPNGAICVESSVGDVCSSQTADRFLLLQTSPRSYEIGPPELVGQPIPSLIFGEVPEGVVEVVVRDLDLNVLAVLEPENSLWGHVVSEDAIPGRVEALGRNGEAVRAEDLFSAISDELQECIAETGASSTADDSVRLCYLMENQRLLSRDSSP